MKKLIFTISLFSILTTFLTAYSTYEDIDRQFEKQKGKAIIRIDIVAYGNEHARVLGYYTGQKMAMLGYEVEKTEQTGAYSITMILKKPSQAELAARKKAQEDEARARAKAEAEAQALADMIAKLKKSIIENDIVGTKSIINNIGIEKINNKEHILSFAIQSNASLDMVKLLINSKADINVKNYHSETPLLLAVQNNNADVVKLLIDSKADLNFNNAGNLLLIASSEGYSDIANYLIKNNVNINIADERGNTPLNLALKKEHASIVKDLLNAGANVNGANPAIKELSKKSMSFIEKIIEENANLSIKDSLGNSFLILTLNEKRFDIAKKLIEKKIDLNVPDSNGSTALMYASYYGNSDIVKLLIDMNVELNIQDNDGDTALIIASKLNNTNIARILIENQVDINSKNKNNDTALMYASYYGNSDIVKLLMDRNADINIQDKNGDTALIMAVYEYSSSETIQSRNENRYLYIQKERGSRKLEIVKLLLDNTNVNVNIQNRYGDTALTLALNEGYIDIAKYLILSKSNINVLTKNDYTPLILALEKGYPDIAKHLINSKINIDFQPSYGEGDTALIVAARKNYTDILIQLIDIGANVNIKNKRDEIAYNYAYRNKNKKAMNSLKKAGSKDPYKLY